MPIEKQPYVITVTYDPEHKVFLGWCDDVPGLNVCCETVDELMEVVESSLPWVLEGIAERDDTIDIAPVYQLAKFSETRAHQ